MGSSSLQRGNGRKGGNQTAGLDKAAAAAAAVDEDAAASNSVEKEELEFDEQAAAAEAMDLFILHFYDLSIRKPHTLFHFRKPAP